MKHPYTEQDIKDLQDELISLANVATNVCEILLRPYVDTHESVVAKIKSSLSDLITLTTIPPELDFECIAHALNHLCDGVKELGEDVNPRLAKTFNLFSEIIEACNRQEAYEQALNERLRIKESGEE